MSFDGTHTVNQMELCPSEPNVKALDLRAEETTVASNDNVPATEFMPAPTDVEPMHVHETRIASLYKL